MTYSTAIEAALAIVNETPSSRVLMMNPDGGFSIWNTDGGSEILDHVANAYVGETDHGDHVEEYVCVTRFDKD